MTAPETVLPAALAAACPDVRAATPADAVPGGPAPRYVAAPATVDEASAVLRAAGALGLAVLPRGGGTRLGWGAPPRRCDLVLDTRRLDAVLEHSAGDQVVRVQAGARLADLARVLAAAGQRLALDPPRADPAAGTAGGGTAGGLVAAGAAGPLRLRYGAPRDLLLGVTMVRADGTVARAGGKVVKNVAGYDLGKLLAGSWGALGLITEVTLRLHPLPRAVAYVSVDGLTPGGAAAALLAAASSKLAPAAAELDWPAPDAPLSAAILLEGDEAGVAQRAEQARALLVSAAAAAGPPPADGRPACAGQWAEQPPPWWGADPGGADGTVLQVACWASRLPAALAALRDGAARAGLVPAVRGSGAAGVLHAALPAGADPAAVAALVTGLRAALAAPDGGAPRSSVVVLRAPAAVRAAVDLWGPVPGLALMRAVKEQFDPGHRMAPGRLAGGI